MGQPYSCYSTPAEIKKGDPVVRAYNLSKNITSIDEYTIQDTASGSDFKVKVPGIDFTIIVTKASGTRLGRSYTIAHYGLLCDGNTFTTPDGGTYTKCLAHRVAKNVHVAFANEEAPLMNIFTDVLDKENHLTVSRMKIGRNVQVASTYADILQKEMTLNFEIKITNPSKETNCMTFTTRAIKMLNFDDKIIQERIVAFKKNLVADGWKEDYADMHCKFLQVLMGMEKIDGKYALSVLNSVIPDETLDAFKVMLRRFQALST